MGAPIFNLHALRGPPFLVYALSKIFEIFFCLYFHYNDYTIKFNLVCSYVAINSMFLFNTFGFSTRR